MADFSAGVEDERAGVFREAMAIGPWRLELISRQPVGGNWGAWVRRASGGRPGSEERFQALTATGATAAEALAALAATIRAAVGEPPAAGGPSISSQPNHPAE
ncbi:MAG: hypothetical protein IT337_08540 [Thermomicrobiales bacterium]|nr:hypothetical protein [Thermomicrobiales bacterium]